MRAWSLPFSYEIRFSSFVTQQLPVSIRIITLFQPLPCMNNAQITVKTSHFCRNPDINIAIEQVLLIENVILDFLDICRLDARVPCDGFNICSAMS